MSDYYDRLETRSPDERRADQSKALLAQIERVMAGPDNCLVADGDVRGIEDLARLPVLRKSDLVKWQAEKPPFGGMVVSNVAHIFQSPGPIYEPGGVSHDWWRMGRGLFAAGIRADDIVQNCF
ncbi:MAG TPA: phenylacetate--CoA ligase family protein, partial [Aliiroseovarius sp.]|nr:phenylacetate--CoA ligase family protein [Aliiroseovarius sp.]